VDVTVAALVGMIDGGPMPACQVLQPELIVRHSSTPPKAD